MKKHFLTLFCSGLLLSISFSQNTTISGTVTDQIGTPVIGATVMVQDTELGAATNNEGFYSFEIPSGAISDNICTVNVSYIGYSSATQEIDVSSGSATLDFTIQVNVLALDGIEVTATKTGGMDIMSTPIAITPFSGKFIENTGAATIADIMQGVPGMTNLAFDENYNTFQIREIAANAGDPTVGYYLDDMPIIFVNAGFVPDVNPFDLERVEVLRGPQGTLYGASSSAGVVKIVTADADPTRISAKADLSYGTVQNGGNSYTAQGAVNLPIIKDQLAIRLAGGYQQLGGYINNSLLGLEEVNESELSYFRAKLNYRPNDQLSIKAMYWKQDKDTGSFAAGNDDFDHPTPFEEFYKLGFDMYNGTITYRFPKLTLYSTTSYIDMIPDTEDGHSGILIDSEGDQKTFNQEIRINSENDGNLNWVLGAFYNNGEGNQKTSFVFPLPDGTFFPSEFIDQNVTSRQIAVFGELYYRFLDGKAQASLGLRYFTDDREQETLLPSIVEVLTLLGIDAKRSTNYNNVSPRFNLAFYPIERTIAYATVANGFRSGLIQPGGNLASAIPFGIEIEEFINEENLWSYEVGFKSELANNEVTIEGALYYNDWSDMIVVSNQLVDMGGIPTPIILYENVDGATSLGFDWNLIYSHPKGLTLAFNGNVNSSEYKSDLPGIAGIKEGDRINHVPKMTLAGSASYRIPLGNSLKLMSFANLQYSSERSEINGGVTYTGDKITVLNARVGVEAKNWGIYLFGNNLLYEDGALFRNNLTPLDRRLRPRNGGINLQLNF